MDAVPDTDVEPDADVEEVEWHGNVENPSVSGTSGAAGSERGASGVHASLPPVPSESRYSEGGGGEGEEGTAASPMEISSSSDSPGGKFSGEEENTGRESKNSGGDGENSSDTEDANEEDPVYIVSALCLRRPVMLTSCRIESPRAVGFRRCSAATVLPKVSIGHPLTRWDIRTQWSLLRGEVVERSAIRWCVGT